MLIVVEPIAKPAAGDVIVTAGIVRALEPVHVAPASVVRKTVSLSPTTIQFVALSIWTPLRLFVVPVVFATHVGLPAAALAL